MQLSSNINNITFYNEETAFAVLHLVGNDGRHSVVKGVCPDLRLIGSPDKARGLSVNAEGEWTNDPKYGRQFSASVIRINTEGMLFFLTTMVKGFGRKLAAAVVKKYGDVELAVILDNHPEELLSFSGIGEKTLAKMVDSWKKQKEYKALAEFFVGAGVDNITPNLIIKIFDHFGGSNAVSAIKENPYCLTAIRGIGFKTADKLALQFGIDPYGELRVGALADYILLTQASESGHTFLLYNDLLSLAAENICAGTEDEPCDAGRLGFALQSVLADGKFYTDKEGRVAIEHFKRKEDEISEGLKKRLNGRNGFCVSAAKAEGFIADKEKQTGKTLGDKQRLAVKNLATLGRNVFMLCGYAGTGKSTTSKIILDFYKENFCKAGDIAACAFTGMASKRVKDLTGYSANTIHSLLRYSGPGKYQFNAKNPLPYDVVLIDESSMISLGVFHALLSAIKLSAIIIMVGDDAQLPPIGEGNVFSDLLNKEWMPKVKLDKIYRQSEDSVLTYFAEFVRKGEPLPKEVYGRDYKDFRFIPKDIENSREYYAKGEDDKYVMDEKDRKRIRDRFLSMVQEDLLRLIKSVAVENGLSGKAKIWNIQVISPMKNTPLGTVDMNSRMQAEMNDAGGAEATIRGFLLKRNDKVIHLKNQNMKVLSRDEYAGFRNSGLSIQDISDRTETERRIFNGNLGMVADIDKDGELFSVIYPEPDGTATVAIYDFSDYKDIIDLGYALTVHKVQGSQFDYVFIPVVGSFHNMLDNKLFYTAITRAKKKCFVMGQPGSLRKACVDVGESRRNTFLSFD